jgi:DNA-binding transcriptional LysR family regulator
VVAIRDIVYGSSVIDMPVAEGKLLRTFCAVVSEGSIQKGARLLGYSQPAATLHIQQLEAHIGAPLLLRAHDGVRLTEHGKRVFHEAQSILSAMERLKIHDRVRVDLRIATIGQVAMHVRKSLLKAVGEAKVYVDTYNSADRVAAAVASGDAALGLAPHVPVSTLAFEHLYDEEFILCVPFDHEFAQNRAVSLAQIAAERLIVTDSACAYRKAIDEAFSRIGYLTRTHIVIGNMSALFDAVVRNMGIAILPRTLISAHGSGRFATVEIAEHVSLSVGALYRQPLDPRLQDVMVRIVSFLRNTMVSAQGNFPRNRTLSRGA